LDHRICSVIRLILSVFDTLLTSSRSITLSGTHQATAGTVLLSVYGWTTNPLVGYYIQETYTSYSGGTHKGTVTSDGSKYDIYKHQQTNQPSITGTATFQQYISVRKNKRSSGTVTTANHFNAWAKLGMKLGSFKYQTVATGGWGNAAGSTNMKVS
jgi:endo-1,4-beta-xylanase